MDGSEAGTSNEHSAPGHAEPFQLFRDDPFDRLLAWLGLPGRGVSGAFLRTVALWAVAWVPMAIAALVEGNFYRTGPGGFAVPRLSFILDLATWAQFWGFIPLATLAERFINARMREAMPYLAAVTEPAAVRRLAERSNRLARSWIPLVACVVLAFVSTWSWAGVEAGNGIATWHSVVVEPGARAWFSGFLDRREWLTVAGAWAAFVALPLFTFLWLRWVWKIGVWTWFLFRLSRQRLRLMAVHPDRTGGLGCLSDVQTSFAFVLFATGVLFCAWLAYKVLWEGIEPTFETVWFPVLGYIFLAPAVFLVPLFMFTGALREARDRALVRLNVLAIDVGQAFRDRWLGDEGRGGVTYLESTHSSNLADLHAAYEAVSEMRIVPFDRRSALELFSSSAVPFAPLLFIVEVEDKVRDVLQFFT